MKSCLKRYGYPVAALAVLFLFFWTCGCASWMQMAPAQPPAPYRGLNESTIITPY